MDWYIILIIVVLAIGAAGAGVWFVKLPKEKKIENLKEWLKWGVTEAEKALGSGTGQLKLRLVYDMAIEKFPWMAGLIAFSVFSGWVDEALEWMNNQLADNKAAKDYVDGEAKEV